MNVGVRIGALVCLGTLGWSVRAQSVFGTVQGAVTDTSGSAIPGAKVTLREVQTNTSDVAMSTASGQYEFLNVRPGRYEVIAEKPAFAATHTQLFWLEPRQSRRVDLTLEVASRAETVFVGARVPMIETEDGTISDTKNFEQISRLPLNIRGTGGTGISAIGAFPGVQQDLWGSGWSISGGLPSQLDVSVDGISAMYIPFHLPLSDAAPSLEMVGDMKVSSVDNNAVFSAMGDATLSTRGGTNQPHGGLFWYHQNAGFDANTYNSPEKAPKVFNTVGASFGGPVLMPGLYNGRNRTFFFADYEANVQRSWSLDQLSVPTSTMRNGDLNGLPGPVPVDPSTGAPFPNNQIPATRISSVARVLLAKYYPAENYPDDITDNYRKIASNNQDTNGYDIRVDHVISQQQRVFTRWSWKDIAALIDWSPLPESRNPIYDRSFVVAHTYAPRTNLSNELRYGFSRSTAIEQSPVNGKQAVADLGLQGLDLRNVSSSAGFPAFMFNGSTGFASIGHGRPQSESGRNYQISDTFSWIRGRHTTRFGSELRRVGFRASLTRTSGDDFGTFSFDDTFTGNDFADLLLGLPTTTTTAVLGPDSDAAVNYWNVFVQDNWRLGRRFVLDFGLRAEVHPAMREKSGDLTNFDPLTGNVIIPDHSVAPAPGFLAAIRACSPGAATSGCTQVMTASQAGLPQGLRVTNRDWNPRLGFAWQPVSSDKISVRGGIGIYTVTLLGPTTDAMIGVHSSDIRTFNNISGSGDPLFTFPNVAPGPNALSTLATESFYSGVAPTLKDPRSYQWNFTIERELPWSTIVRASYVGVQSVGFPEAVDLNQVPVSPQPFSVNRRPFQNWAYLRSLENLGFANYQGLHLEGSRRFRNDLFFQASYQYAKDLGSLGTVGTLVLPRESSPLALTDRFDTRYDRGNLPGVRRQRLLLTALVPFPFKRGRTIGRGWNRFVDAFAGGWELSTVTLVESGSFQTPTIAPSRDQSNTDVAGRRVFARPDRIGNGNLPNPVRDRYYDASAFTVVPSGAGRFGNAGAGILEGPGTVTVAAGASKTFTISEHARSRFEATFTNVANHPNFQAPSVMLGTPQFGRLIAVQGAENAGNRTGQIGVRLEF